MAQQVPNQSSKQPAAKPDASQIRLIILLVVLVLGVIAVAYDFLLARPNSRKANDIVNALIDKRISAAAGTAPVTNEEVQKELNRKPSRTNTTENYTEEIFSWRRGLLLLKYNLYVIYTKDRQGRLELHSCSLNTPPAPEHLPASPVRVLTNTDTSKFAPADPEEGAGGTVRPSEVTPEANVTPSEPEKTPNAK
jgi:hypothetical protein